MNQMTPLTMLPLMFLSACGGGGSGGETVSSTDTNVGSNNNFQGATTGNSSASSNSSSSFSLLESQAEVNNDNSQQSASTIAASNLELSDLQAAAEFDFSNDEQVNVNISYPGFDAQKRYINICTQWLDQDLEIINYNSCVYRGQLSADELEIKLSLAGHSEQLIAEVLLLSLAGSSSEIVVQSITTDQQQIEFQF
ncbi:hypothetical protein DBZ36_10325 [Alginatibacterium sediminis]|uniref:Uncharacterized protein n=1 Tax=Alginatibacterium sediminis TaxID=2164068 RepID=A0A420EDS3_9ALTE|nr:hypothetical protein [Alginatibacterium sediminis]RKF18782.1 hypothetical protein DBZ36_10325 [Alginatibacterium sediminis]